MINNDARPYASLSSGLLARKGTAKPAMRPQGYNGFEDLGWNDMGQDPLAEDDFADALPEHVPSSIAALTPAPKHGKSEEPEVVAQQRAIAESFETEAVAEAVEAIEPVEAEVQASAAVVPLRKRQAQAIDKGRKAAFTLRLDARRHLRLRLATAVTGRSAQQIVTGALDALLETIPEIETLAERVPSGSARRS
jgi:hypothetical protein